MTSRRAISYWAAVALLLAVPVAMIARKTWTLESGAVVRLRTVPVDPRDLFRGDYVALRYEISTVPRERLHLPSPTAPGETLFVTLEEGEDGFWTAKEVRAARPEAGPVALRGKVLKAGDDSIEVEYGIESYFVPEGEGRTIEAARGKAVVEVSVDALGGAVIREVKVEPAAPQETTIRLLTLPADPKQVLRGGYLDAPYEITLLPRALAAGERKPQAGQPAWVALEEGPGGIWQARAILGEFRDEPGRAVLGATVREVHGATVLLQYTNISGGLPEGHERFLASPPGPLVVELAVQPWGGAVVRRVLPVPSDPPATLVRLRTAEPFGSDFCQRDRVLLRYDISLLPWSLMKALAPPPEPGQVLFVTLAEGPEGTWTAAAIHRTREEAGPVAIRGRLFESDPAGSEIQYGIEEYPVTAKDPGPAPDARAGLVVEVLVTAEGWASIRGIVVPQFIRYPEGAGT